MRTISNVPNIVHLKRTKHAEMPAIYEAKLRFLSTKQELECVRHHRMHRGWHYMLREKWQAPPPKLDDHGTPRAPTFYEKGVDLFRTTPF